MHPERQTSPHPHCVVIDPSQRFAFVPDLGSDCVVTYQYDARLGALLRCEGSTRLPFGAGPRMMVVHPDAPYAWVNTEIGNTIHGYRMREGQLSEIQVVSTLPESAKDGNGADLKLHPNGRFLYATNRTHQSIASFLIDTETGLLTPTGCVPSGGAFPRAIAIDPSGTAVLAGNEHTNEICGFRIDSMRGRLTPLGTLTQMPGPASLAFASIG